MILEETANLANNWILPFIKIEPEAGFEDNLLSDWGLGNFPEAGGNNIFNSDDYIEIYDLNEELLFIDHFINLQNNKVLISRVSVQDILNPKLISSGIKEHWDILKKLNRTKSDSNYNVINSKIYCYAYPKLGVKCIDEKGDFFILDLFDESIHKIQSLSKGSTELLGTYSFNIYFNDIEIDHNKELRMNSKLKNIGNSLSEKVVLANKNSQEQIIPNFDLIPQSNSYFCAVAVAQMILKYHGMNFTQDEIANEMKTGKSGSTNELQLTTYRKLSNDYLDCILDLSPTYSEADQYFNKNLPIKNGIPRHARAIAGSKIINTSNLLSKWLYVYDPWPVNEGSIYWEEINTIRHTNYIMVKTK